MKSRTALRIMGMLLVTSALQISACSPAPAPAPTATVAPAKATTAPTAVPTAVPTKPPATPTISPSATPAPRTSTPARTATPTQVPRTPTRTATPATAARTPTPSGTAPAKPAAGTPMPAAQLPSGATDCGSDLGCFIEASRAGRAARVNYTMAVDFFGMFLSNTDTLIISGKEGTNLLFSQRTVQAVAALTEELMKVAQSRGLSEADMQKALTSATGIADLVSAAAKNTSAEGEKQLASAREAQQARIGTGKDCKFPQAALTSTLERWKNGQYSSSDYDGAQCTDVRPAPTPAPTLQPGVVPAVSPSGLKLGGASALPAELKSVPLPPGFGVEEVNSQRYAPNGVFKSADASLYGVMTVNDLSAFFRNGLAAEWQFQAEAVVVTKMVGEYVNKKDPTLTLYIDADETPRGTNVSLRVEKK